MSDPKNVTVTVTLIAAASVPPDALPVVQGVSLEEGAAWEIPLENGTQLPAGAQPIICKYTAPCFGEAFSAMSFRLEGPGDCQYFCAVGWNAQCGPAPHVDQQGTCEYNLVSSTESGNQVTFQYEP